MPRIPLESDINKTQLGLSNIDNTSDINKPISTATQTALNTKVNNTGNETISGIKTFTNGIKVTGVDWDTNKISLEGASSNIEFRDTDTSSPFWQLGQNGTSFYLLEDVDRNGSYDSTPKGYPIQIQSDASTLKVYGKTVSTTDHTHPQYLNNDYLVNQTISNCDTVDTDGVNFKYSNQVAINKPVGTDHALMTQSYSADWSTQMASDWRTNNWLVRTQSNGTWGTWKALIKEGDTATDSTNFAGRDIGQRTYLDNMKRAITGGGTITYTSDYYLKWSYRFISIAVAESSTTTTNGYFDINMPPVGTVIHGVGGTADVTVTAAGIYLNTWSSLWYEPVIGGNNTSQDGNFHISNYNQIDGVVIPDHWILVANTNGDTSTNGGGYTARLCNGKSIKSGTNLYPDTAWIYPTFENSWVNYDNTYGYTRYKRVNNVVIIEGLVKDGTISSSGSVFTLPVGFRPRARLVGATLSNSDVARIDITTDGKVVPYTGSNSWYSVWCTFSVT